MTDKKTDNALRPALLKGASLFVSTVPVAVCTLCYFPLWKVRGGAEMLSGFTALLLVLAALPLYRAVKKALASPDVWVMWFFAFLLFVLLSKIADEMTVIAAVGTVGNLIGAIFWKAGERMKKGEKTDAGQ